MKVSSRFKRALEAEVRRIMRQSRAKRALEVRMFPTESQALGAARMGSQHGDVLAVVKYQGKFAVLDLERPGDVAILNRVGPDDKIMAYQYGQRNHNFLYM